MKFTQNYKVKFHDTNSNEILGASGVLKLMQETGMLHMEYCRPSYRDLLNQDKALILSNVRINIYSPISSHDEVTVTTWATGSRGFTTYRSFQIHRGEELLCEANTIWALVSVSEKKLVKISEVDFSAFEPEPQLELDSPSKVRIPNELKLSLVGEYTVRYSDTDINMHVNNTNYPDMFFNYLPNPEGKTVTSVAISYLNDAKAGDNLKFYMGKTDGKYFMRSVHEDGRVNAEVEFTTETLG